MTDEPVQLKTLYAILRKLDKPMFSDDVCNAVKEWMSQCKYWDAGWCYAPDDVETSASSQSACFDPDYCPYLKSQMTDIKFTSPSGETTLKFEDTGRIGTVAPKTQLHIKMDEPVKYEKPMTAVQDIEAQIKVLQSKLEFYKELKNHKTPEEIAYKRHFGHSPEKDISWYSFKEGYKSALKDWKVEENTKETLYDVLLNEGYKNYDINGFLRILNSFLSDKIVETYDDGDTGEEYITFTLQKSLLEVPNDL